MKWPLYVVALSLVMGATAHLPAAASPTTPASPANIKNLGQVSHAYSDGKGGMFLIYTRRDGRRLIFRMMSNLAQEKANLLPPSWKPPQGWLEVNKWEAISRLRTKPLAVRPPPQTPPDRYHPGVKLLARSGQE